MHTNLMRFPRFREYAKQSKIAKALLDSPERPRVAPVLAHHHSLWRGGVRRKRRVDLAAVRSRLTNRQRQVFLLNRVVLELMREMTLSVDVFGEQEDAAGIFVESMHHAKPRIGSA